MSRIISYEGEYMYLPYNLKGVKILRLKTRNIFNEKMIKQLNYESMFISMVLL